MKRDCSLQCLNGRHFITSWNFIAKILNSCAIYRCKKMVKILNCYLYAKKGYGTLSKGAIFLANTVDWGAVKLYMLLINKLRCLNNNHFTHVHFNILSKERKVSAGSTLKQPMFNSIYCNIRVTKTRLNSVSRLGRTTYQLLSVLN